MSRRLKSVLPLHGRAQLTIVGLRLCRGLDWRVFRSPGHSVALCANGRKTDPSSKRTQEGES